jgi:hypothetical protein
MYFSPNIIRVIKSRKMRWAGHVAHMGRGDMYAGVWWGNLRERDHLEGPGVGGRIRQDGASGSGMGGNEWIDLAQNRDRWRELVYAVKNLRVP